MLCGNTPNNLVFLILFYHSYTFNRCSNFCGFSSIDCEKSVPLPERLDCHKHLIHFVLLPAASPFLAAFALTMAAPTAKASKGKLPELAKDAKGRLPAFEMDFALWCHACL
jgi:hypothetical protein